MMRSLIFLIFLGLVGPVEASLAQIPSVAEGVRVHRYGIDARPRSLWAVGPPVLTLGHLSGDASKIFWKVVGVHAIADGQLVVGNGGTSELRFFDRSSGEHIRTVAGVGPGPGEIDGLWSLWFAGGDIVAVDAVGRASFFDASGVFQHSIPPPVSDRALRLRRAGFFSDGSALAYSVESNPEIPSGMSTSWMRIVTIEGDRPTFLMRYPHHFVTRKGAARPWGLVFGPVARLRAIGDRFCVGFPQVYVIDCYTRGGRAIYRIVREAYPRRRVTDQDREDYIAVNQAANPGPRGAPYIAYLRENAQFADKFPAFGRFVAAENGDLWVGPFVPEGDTPVMKPFPLMETTWSVYSPKGLWLADVVLPARFRLMSVGHDFVAGVAHDGNGVETVLLLPLRKGDGEGLSSERR